MKHLESLLRKHAVFVISPYIKNVQDAYNAWPLDGEEKKAISPRLLRRLMEYKARDIINRKESDYRKALKKWQTDSR
jgi:hypothetical protein